MYYYPKSLNYKDFVQLTFIIPGGWGADLEKKIPHHFLTESLTYGPTRLQEDPIEYLWNNVYDFWSITSFESIRLGVAVPRENVAPVLSLLHEMLLPREFDNDFITQEIHELKTTWTRERDKQEDQDLRDLFAGELVVHPNPEGVSNISEKDIPALYNSWQNETPHLIIMGEVNTNDLLLAQNLFGKKDFNVVDTIPEVKSIKVFNSADRLGLKIGLTASDWRELFLIEIWDRQFEAKIFFEYHLNDFFIWTSKIEDPLGLWKKLKTEKFSRELFEKSKFEYGEYLTKLYNPSNTGQLEKLAEFVEGFHAHEFQSGTYGFTSEDFDIRKKVLDLTYEEMVEFWEGMVN